MKAGSEETRVGPQIQPHRALNFRLVLFRCLTWWQRCDLHVRNVQGSDYKLEHTLPSIAVFCVFKKL